MKEQKSLKSWYKIWWGLILTVLFFPFIVPYLVWTKTTWNKWGKIAITAICAIFIISSGFTPKKPEVPSPVKSAEVPVHQAQTEVKEIKVEDAQTKKQKQAEAEKKKQEADAKARTDMIESQFSPWDGSHYGLTKYIKSTMNDPDSYQHVETRYGDMKDYLIVSTTFRGKNAFGGVITNAIKAKVSLAGEVLKILEP